MTTETTELRDPRSPDGTYHCWQCFDSNLNRVRECEAPGCILRQEVEERNAR